MSRSATWARAGAPSAESDARRWGARAAFGLAAAAALLGFAHAGVVANYAYPVAAVVIAILLLTRDRHLDYLEFTVWLWFLDPEVRRVVDYGSVYHSTSPVIISAELVSLVSLYKTLNRRGPVYREVRAAVAVIIPVLAYGFVNGAVHGHVAGAAVDVLFYGAPIAFGAWLLLAPVNRAELTQRIYDVAVPALLILGAYGIVQFLVLPPWDSDWITNSGITAIGNPEALHIRAFSFLDSPGPYGQTLAVLLLLVIQPVRRSMMLRRIAVVVGVVGLGLSQTRAAWIALAIGIVLLLLTRRLTLGRSVLAAAAVVILIGLFGGPARDVITGRFGSSVQAGSQDTSFVARTNFQAKIAPQVISNIAGQGLGSTGVGTKLVGGTDAGPDTDLIHSFDSGLFEILYTFGSLPGLAFLIVVFRLAWRGTTRYLRRGPASLAFTAAALIGLTSALLFTDVLKTVYGADFWLLVGSMGAPPVARRSWFETEIQVSKGATTSARS